MSGTALKITGKSYFVVLATVIGGTTGGSTISCGVVFVDAVAVCVGTQGPLGVSDLVISIFA